MNYKPNTQEMDRLMHQVRRLEKQPYLLMREALNKFLDEIEQQEAMELMENGKQQ
ncbi:TPA: hypothetical protein LNI27_003455 [Vibrio cholerae]|nr:hypothetical protein [Vibrio cholerae]HAS2823251.1 hypothetical protein [Vibrio cholerae]HAS2826298.1 hypothetical protein [Vibrio cholerae]HAS2831311.1 hypothetical protein [Vibrio cholerae]HAS2834927.1 hypothetical protein [Vibrio cholerae]